MIHRCILEVLCSFQQCLGLFFSDEIYFFLISKTTTTS